MADNSRTIKTGLFGKKNKDILNSVIGQWSDGIWENNPQMAKYWKFADVTMPNGEVLLEIDTDRSDGYHWNGFYGLSDDKVKEIFGRYVKEIIKRELSDGLNGDWKRDCTSECDYLTRSDDEPITVKDAYYAYEMLKGRNVSKHPEYSEAFYARKDDKDYQIEIELEDGPSAEDPERLTVVLDGKRETVDVPKDGTEDHYRKAIEAGLKKLGYKMMEGKLPSMDESTYPVFIKIVSKDDYDKLIVPALGDILKKGYSFDDIKGKWFELGAGEGKDYIKERKKTMRQIVRGDGAAQFIFWYGGDTLDTLQASEYVDNMGMDASDYGISFDDDTFESKKCESDGWEGWEDVTDLEPTIKEIEKLAYELRSCVRGAYTNCRTWGELSEYIKGLASDLESAGDNASYVEDEEN